MAGITTNSFNVLNNTGATIENVSVSHAASGHPTMTWSAGSMAPNTLSPTTAFATDGGSTDNWSVTFLLDGELLTGTCGCGYETEDYSKNAVVVLNPKQWNVIMPVSSSCEDKDYHQG
ncbi:MAG: hypothetical protein Q8P41_03210 [Pseudomonadota bacterium]|nr:hypothetical protein [Pseudomonadota bacterium]